MSHQYQYNALDWDGDDTEPGFADYERRGTLNEELRGSGDSMDLNGVRVGRDGQPVGSGSCSSAGRLISQSSKPFLVILVIAFLSLAAVSFSGHEFSSSSTGRKRSRSSIVNGKLVLEEDEDGRVEYSVLSEDEKKLLYEDYLAKYNKTYNDTAAEERFLSFKSSLELIDERNTAEKMAGGSAVHGITKFSDLTQEEFSELYLTATPPATSSMAELYLVEPYKGSAEVVSWIDTYTSGVKDQGYCGSCWAFSVTSQMEADGVRLGLFSLNTTLSAQQIVSCDTQSFGCAGGWTERAYQYIQQAGGVALEQDYAYTSYYDVTGTCMEDPSKFYLTTAGYYTVENEQAMIDYVKSTGPLSVCVDASDWATYTRGVVTVCGTDVDHCVQIVAVDTSSTNGYWKIRNSWGTEWGEGGYIRLSVGGNTCGISTDPTFSAPEFVNPATRW